MKATELAARNWHQYSDRYWQRDDGAVHIVFRSRAYIVSRTHCRFQRYASEVLGEVATLSEAVDLAAAIPLDAEAAAKQREYINRVRAEVGPV